VADALVLVRDLTKHYGSSRGLWGARTRVIRALDGVSFGVARGETLGIVGESGCGKSTLGKTLLRLIEPTRGAAFFEGRDLMSLRAGALRAERRHLQMVFQDPYSSLNPRMRVRDALAEPMLIHGIGASRAERFERVRALLADVGLPHDAAERYPHEFSGGQRQRIVIARALAAGPAFVVADEPVSALDVSVQAQVLNLLRDLQERRSLTYLFIAHDLRIVRHMSNRVAVMYLGRIVEMAGVDAIYLRPAHPYTRALLAAAPVADPSKRRASLPVVGEVPDPAAPPTGCAFHPRCPIAEDRCKSESPILREVEPGHEVACHLA
jgi:oligopeptide/dipeptide ABC transporter ATP-binding protein